MVYVRVPPELAESPSSASHGLVSPIWRDWESISQGLEANASTFRVKTISRQQSDRARSRVRVEPDARTGVPRL